MAQAAEPGKVLADYYRLMVLIRTFELRAAEMYTRAKIGGYCHLNLGEEATVAGLMDALRPDDYLYANYRVHGYALARGLDPRNVMAELFGRVDGVSGGWGGSMHLFDAGRRLMGGYGIVGGQIPLATGAAYALAYRQQPGPESNAVMCLLGEGTTAIGAFHESLNIAALWSLPIVYVVVNNRTGMGTTVEHSSAEPEIYKRAAAYRMPGKRVDGTDPLAVREGAAEALRLAREERRPCLLETMSYRLKGHSVVDPARYRSQQEVAEVQAHDPVPLLRARLIEDGTLTEDQALAIEDEAVRTVDDAVAFADASPDPAVDTLFAHAYASSVANAPEQLPGDHLFTH
jgi:pyruvate dehydrogenase E1 component alpha subunit